MIAVALRWCMLHERHLAPLRPNFQTVPYSTKVRTQGTRHSSGSSSWSIAALPDASDSSIHELLAKGRTREVDACTLQPLTDKIQSEFEGVVQGQRFHRLQPLDQCRRRLRRQFQHAHSFLSSRGLAHDPTVRLVGLSELGVFQHEPVHNDRHTEQLAQHVERGTKRGFSQRPRKGVLATFHAIKDRCKLPHQMSGVTGLALHGDASPCMSRRDSCSQITCLHSSALDSADRYSEITEELQRGSDRPAQAPSLETSFSRDPEEAHFANNSFNGSAGLRVEFHCGMWENHGVPRTRCSRLFPAALAGNSSANKIQCVAGGSHAFFSLSRPRPRITRTRSRRR